MEMKLWLSKFLGSSKLFWVCWHEINFFSLFHQHFMKQLFYQFPITKKIQTQISSTEKLCIKKLLVKCWWNWHLTIITWYERNENYYNTSFSLTKEHHFNGFHSLYFNNFFKLGILYKINIRHKCAYKCITIANICIENKFNALLRAYKGKMQNTKTMADILVIKRLFSQKVSKGR